MWNRVKQVTFARAPTLRRIDGRYASSPNVTFQGTVAALHSQLIQQYRIPNFAANSGNITSTMSFSSIHQNPHETSLPVDIATHPDGVVERTIREKLVASLSPVTHLTIMNESHRHNV